jgi:hypothetical protein
MDEESDDATDASVEVACPHCGTTEHDDLEVLEDDCLTRLHCQSCTKHYFMLIAECRLCGDESVRTWTSKPPSVRAHLGHLCPQCRAGGHSNEAASKDNVLVA